MGSSPRVCLNMFDAKGISLPHSLCVRAFEDEKKPANVASSPWPSSVEPLGSLQRLRFKSRVVVSQKQSVFPSYMSFLGLFGVN